METVWSTEECALCHAPLRPSELDHHELACMAIAAPSLASAPEVEVPEDLAAYCRYMHLKDQEETALRTPLQDTLLPERPVSPAMKRYQDWLRDQREGYHRTGPTPPGKHVCLLCNGLTHMYPNCTGCDGRGFVA